MDKGYYFLMPLLIIIGIMTKSKIAISVPDPLFNPCVLSMKIKNPTNKITKNITTISSIYSLLW